MPESFQPQRTGEDPGMAHASRTLRQFAQPYLDEIARLGEQVSSLSAGHAALREDLDAEHERRIDTEQERDTAVGRALTLDSELRSVVAALHQAHGELDRRGARTPTRERPTSPDDIYVDSTPEGLQTRTAPPRTAELQLGTTPAPRAPLEHEDRWTPIDPGSIFGDLVRERRDTSTT